MEFYIDHFGNDLSPICWPDDNQEEFLVDKEKELQKGKDKLINEKEEIFLLSNIVHEIIALTPDIQRDLVLHLGYQNMRTVIGCVLFYLFSPL